MRVLLPLVDKVESVEIGGTRGGMARTTLGRGAQHVLASYKRRGPTISGGDIGDVPEVLKLAEDEELDDLKKACLTRLQAYLDEHPHGPWPALEGAPPDTAPRPDPSA